MRRHVPQLDGLRTVAVILVVLYHVGYLASGYVGVDIFFALSGYLITNILLTEYAEGRWSLRGFYARRLYPALLLMLVLVLPFGVLLAGGMGHYVADALIAGICLSDLVSLPGMSWMGGLLHTWSLAAEEQFYLVWPLVLLFMLKRGFSRRTMCVGIAGSGALMITLLVAHGGQYLPVTRGDGLLFGCSLAVATRDRTVPRPRLTTAVAVAVLVVIVASAAATSNSHLVSASMGLSVVAGAALIGGHVGADTVVLRFLSL